MTTVSGSVNALSVLQYNTLANSLSDAFPLVDKKLLSWSHRKGLLLATILQNAPDVICLQEVDAKDYQDWFAPELGQYGYSSYFASKTTKSRKDPDGCAMFYREAVLTLVKLETVRYVEHVPVEFQKASVQVGLVVRFALVATGAEVVVATTHLKAKYGFDELRLAQTQALCQHLPPGVPTVVAGDFNADPWTDAIKYMTAGFRSAYPLDDPNFFTTWKMRPPTEDKRIIDYIFHTPNIECVETIPIPSADLIPEPRLPNAIFPSDHLPLMARFRW